MKFQPEKLEGEAIIQGYDEQGVVINGQRFAHSVFFGTNLLPVFWAEAHPGALGLPQVKTLMSQCPQDMEVLLIGTGATQQFPATEVRRFFIEKNCPVEYMDTPAACRTYNILIGEGRKVVAALLQETP